MATILIVGDSPANRELLGTLLAGAGYRVVQANDGDEALSAVGTERPDLVIADILMPTMDGPEFVRRLRGNMATSQIPVLFWSAEYHEREAHSVARACGLSWTLTRPSKPEVILRTVRAVLGEAQLASGDANADAETEHVRLSEELFDTTAELRLAGLRLEALIASDLEMADEGDPVQLLERYCRSARKLLGARYAALYVADERLPQKQYFCTAGVSPVVAEQMRQSLPVRGILADVMERQCTVMAGNPGGDPVALGFPSAHPSIGNILAAPISALTHRYGWLYLADKISGDGFTERDERLLGTLSKQVGRFYENGSAFKEAERHAAALATEIAERHVAEEALRQNAEHTRFALEAAGVGTWETNLITGARRCSRLYETLHGVSEGSLEGPLTAYLDTIHPGDRKLVIDSIAGVSEAAPDLATTYRSVWPDGSVHWIQGRGRFFYDERGTAIRATGIATDVTERRMLEEQYLQSQKMEAIGQLAGGVYYVWKGTRRHHVTLSSLAGGRWDTPKAVAADVAIAAALWGLWAGIETVLPGSGTVGSLLPRTPLEYAVWMLVAVSAGFCEELVFRGYFQRQFHALTGSTAAAIALQAMIFGVGHFYEGAWAVAKITLYGALFGVLAAWRTSLRPGMLAHAWTDIFAVLR